MARQAPERVFVGEALLVQLKIVNHGPTLHSMYLEDEPPGDAHLTRGSPFLLGGLKKGEEVTLRYEISLREPGNYEFGATKVTLTTPFGLFERKLVFFAPFSIRVYPKILTPRLRPIKAYALGWVGISPSKTRGGRLEFMNIRNYVPGDRLSDVNWRASARTGTQLVNEWQTERGLDCVVIVDLFADDVPKVGDWTARGDVIEASYELARSFLARGDRVGMLVMGSLLQKIKPGFGMKRLKAMVEGLIDSEIGGVWNLEFVEDYLKEFFREQYVKRQGVLYFVSAGANMRLVGAIERLAQEGFICNSVMVSAQDSEVSALVESGTDTDAADAGYEVAKAELRWFENRLALRSNVYEWSRGRGLSEMRRKER